MRVTRDGSYRYEAVKDITSIHDSVGNSASHNGRSIIKLPITNFPNSRREYPPDPGGRAVKGVGLRLLDRWECRFESR